MLVHFDPLRICFMLVHFDSLRICLHDGGSICLVPPDPFNRYFRSGGSIYWSPRTALWGDRIHRDTGTFFLL